MFTQPVGQSGVPSQNAEHILGEVFLDSLAVPAGPLPDLNLNLNFSGSSSCLGGLAGRTKTSGLNSSGGSASLGGSTSSGSLSPSASGFDSGSSATGGGGVPTSLAALSSLLRSKPMWLLLAYLVWQTLAVVTGVSLWNWRRGGAT